MVEQRWQDKDEPVTKCYDRMARRQRQLMHCFGSRVRGGERDGASPSGAHGRGGGGPDGRGYERLDERAAGPTAAASPPVAVGVVAAAPAAELVEVGCGSCRLSEASAASPGGGARGGGGGGARPGSARGVLRLHLQRGAGLKAADRNGKSDPYVVATVGRQQRRSRTVKRTLDPVWDEPLDFAPSSFDELLAAGLALRVMDHDTFSRDDPLGAIASVDLTPLAARDAHEYALALPTQGTLHFALSWIPTGAPSAPSAAAAPPPSLPAPPPVVVPAAASSPAAPSPRRSSAVRAPATRPAVDDDSDDERIAD